MAKDKKSILTPLMKQYEQIKTKYPDAILLFRVGDFYETFGKDAVKASKILGIVLTKRANGSAAHTDLAGFPHHSLDIYLPKLVKAGQRVAICDQLEDPKMTKTIVKRGVTELVTPGVAINDQVLNYQKNNFLASVHLEAKTSGIAFLDISTGEFFASQGNNEYIDKLLQSFNPSEVIVQKSMKAQFIADFGDKFYVFTFDDWVFTEDFGKDTLLRHFNTNSLKGFGVDAMPKGIIAAGACLHYLSETHHTKLEHITNVSRIDESEYVWLDRFTINNLEILHSPNENATSMIDVIDKTQSPMGSRLMRRWIVLPLKDKQRIENRSKAVEFLIEKEDVYTNLSLKIKQIGDLERLISKVAMGRVNPRELLQVKRALNIIQPMKDDCMQSQNSLIQSIGDQMNICELIRDRIDRELQEDPPALVNKGNVIKEGVNSELDKLRAIAFSGKDYLVQLRQREIEITGISSLKVGYNNVFGYYLEVTNSHKDKVPEEWHRKQTLTNAERYITEELKEYETKILGAEEKIASLEAALYEALVKSVSEYVKPIQLNAILIARLDCLLSFAQLAKENNYCKPEINEGLSIEIKQGRHPVIEQQMFIGEEYIANDVYLDNETQQIIIITGPNMSGKSALLRQTALIVLMAQMGSFVPAESAKIGYVDKIFTRVGASDNISSGESTFMVEMNETASIVNNISNRSLVLLDEIGRGTSTYDGISIAWAIAEYLHEHPQFKAKVLFATHYHELNEMAASFKRIKNFHILVKEYGNKILFLRKFVEGGTEHSFGIHVARMAGMPKSLVKRADEVLIQLEKSHSNSQLSQNVKELAANANPGYQLSLIQLDDPLLQQIKEDIINIDINRLSPVEALIKLHEIKKLLK